MKPKRTPALCLLLYFALASTIVQSQAPPLTLQQAIQRALAQNPENKAVHADERASQASAKLARTALLPQLSFVEDISRGNDPVYAFGNHLRQGQFTQADFALDALNRPHPLGNFSSRLAGSWVAFDSFKTQREIRAAALQEKSASLKAKAMNQTVILDVIRAYEAVLFAAREVEVARHQEETANALLAQADDRVKAGLTVESDRMLAAVNVAARKQERIAAEGEVDLAWTRLSISIGDPELPKATLQPMEPRQFPQRNLEEDLASALARPDLAAMKEGQAAQVATVGAAKSSLGPRVSTYGDWEEDRGAPTSSGHNNWIAGVQVSIDLLPIGKRAELARESANQARVDAQLAAARQQVRLQVSQAQIRCTTADLSVQAAQAGLNEASESLRILSNRYNAGLATMTDMLRAEDAQRQSEASYWQAVYASTAAYAEQLYAIGTLTPEAAEVLQ